MSEEELAIMKKAYYYWKEYVDKEGRVIGKRKSDDI